MIVKHHNLQPSPLPWRKCGSGTHFLPGSIRAVLVTRQHEKRQELRTTTRLASAQGQKSHPSSFHGTGAAFMRCTSPTMHQTMIEPRARRMSQILHTLRSMHVRMPSLGQTRLLPGQASRNSLAGLLNVASSEAAAARYPHQHEKVWPCAQDCLQRAVPCD